VAARTPPPGAAARALLPLLSAASCLLRATGLCSRRPLSIYVTVFFVLSIGGARRAGGQDEGSNAGEVHGLSVDSARRSAASPDSPRGRACLGMPLPFGGDDEFQLCNSPPAIGSVTMRLDAGVCLASLVPSSMGAVSSPSQWKVRESHSAGARFLTPAVNVLPGGTHALSLWRF
jgi:hypothetical protein